MNLDDIKIGTYYYVFMIRYFSSVINKYCVVKVVSIDKQRNEIGCLLIIPDMKLHGQFYKTSFLNYDFKKPLGAVGTSAFNNIFEKLNKDLKLCMNDLNERFKNNYEDDNEYLA